MRCRPRTGDLKQPLRRRRFVKTIGAQIDEPHLRGLGGAEKTGARLGEQDLAPVGSEEETCGVLKRRTGGDRFL
jgi:hypothetical protein